MTSGEAPRIRAMGEDRKKLRNVPNIVMARAIVISSENTPPRPFKVARAHVSGAQHLGTHHQNGSGSHPDQLERCVKPDDAHGSRTQKIAADQAVNHIVDPGKHQQKNLCRQNPEIQAGQEPSV
jgi:hypothetical protein